MGEEYIAAVASLLRAAEAADGHPPLGEHKWIDLVQGGRSGFAGFVARTPDSSRLLGYAQLSRGVDSWGVEYAVHPSARDEHERVATDLLRAVLAEIADEGGGHVHLWVPKPGPTQDAIARAVGLERGRELYQMRRDLPLGEELARSPRAPVRPFVVGSDEASWLEVNNRAFHGHPEQGAWSAATLEERERQPWYDAADFLLHETDGRLDAFCWTKVHDDERGVGEVYVLGVDPASQSRGLGRSVLLAGLDHLAALGLCEVVLYVDASDHGAVHLYRSIGFAVDHRDQAYVGDVGARVP